MSDARNRLIAYAMLGAGMHICTCGHLRFEHEGHCRAGFVEPSESCGCSEFSEAVA